LIERQNVLLTTSRKPTANIRTLCKDLSYVFPNFIKINRGKLSLESVAEEAAEVDVKKVIIIDRWEKGFGKIEFFEVGHDGLKNVLPAVFLRNAKFRRNFVEQMPTGRKVKSVAIAVASKENFEVEKFRVFLVSFFDVPAVSLDETIRNSNDVIMQIVMDYSKQMTITFRLIPKLVEVGPRIEISYLTWERT
jgi:rRNA maturation protein Rpf1